MTDSFSLQHIVFFQVADTNSKLRKLCETIFYHFERMDNFLIIVSDEKTEKYVDELLWKIPQESFIPHESSSAPCNEKIIITKTKENLNNASFIFNLSSEPLFFDEPCRIIYEFEDLASEQKKEISQNKFKSYKQKGLVIESR
jgi:DNA polymerase IIIc chi subunit